MPEYNIICSQIYTFLFTEHINLGACNNNIITRIRDWKWIRNGIQRVVKQDRNENVLQAKPINLMSFDYLFVNQWVEITEFKLHYATIT